MGGLAEIIKMLKEELGPKRARALLYLVAIAAAVWAINLIYTNGVVPLSKLAESVIPLFSGQHPKIAKQDIIYWCIQIAVSCMTGAAFFFVTGSLFNLFWAAKEKRISEMQADLDARMRSLNESRLLHDETGALLEKISTTIKEFEERHGESAPGKLLDSPNRKLPDTGSDIIP